MRHVGLFWSDETENTPIIDWDSSHLDFEKMHLDIWKYTSGDLQTKSFFRTIFKKMFRLLWYRVEFSALSCDSTNRSHRLPR